MLGTIFVKLECGPSVGIARNRCASRRVIAIIGLK